MKAKEVKKILGVTQQTLYNYTKRGKIKFVKLSPTHSDYDEADVMALIGRKEAKIRVSVTYSRVSATKQKNDLLSQMERLLHYTTSNGEQINTQYSDIKSGMNFEREGLDCLIKRVINKEIDKVYVENKDRLARFGFDLLVMFFKQYGTQIVVVNNMDNITYEQELVEDLISIIHYFSMKSYSNRRKINKLKAVLIEE